MWRSGRDEAPERGTQPFPVAHLQQRGERCELSRQRKVKKVGKKKSKADRCHSTGQCFEHIGFMFRNIAFIPFGKMLRGCDFFRMGKALFRKLRIPSDFNICVSWFLCSRAGYRGGNDLVAQCLRLTSYCLEHVVCHSVREQSEENAQVQNIMWYRNTQETVAKESIWC